MCSSSVAARKRSTRRFRSLVPTSPPFRRTRPSFTTSTACDVVRKTKVKVGVVVSNTGRIKQVPLREITPKQMSVRNAHYQYLLPPAIVSNQFGDLERWALRPRKVRGADVWGKWRQNGAARYRVNVSRLYVRAAPCFPSSSRNRVLASLVGIRKSYRP
jgi:hypothetical protein